MDLLDRRLLIVVGKGGVGKTTVATGLALAASRRGKKVLLALVNSNERVSQLLGTNPIGPQIVSLREHLDAVHMTPDAALEEYGLMILKSRAIFNAVFKNRLVRAFLKGTPGLDAWSMLGKAFYHACPPTGEPDYDLVIIDAPATGHALHMLRVPFVIENVAPAGLLRRDAARAAQMLRDPQRAGAVLVTLPEDMPANETIELWDALTNELEIKVLQLVINRVLKVLFAEEERSIVESLPSKIGEDSGIRGLAVAGRRRVLREAVQARAIRRVCSHIDAPCTDVRHYDDLGKDPTTIDVLSEALLENADAPEPCEPKTRPG